MYICQYRYFEKRRINIYNEINIKMAIVYAWVNFLQLLLNISLLK